jgi:hypothetical protein
MKIRKMAVVSIVVLGLVLGLAFPAMAGDDEPTSQTTNHSPKILVGKVVSLGTDSFTIEARGQEFTINVDGDTKYFKVPARRMTLSAARNRLELRQDQIELRPTPQRTLRVATQQVDIQQVRGRGRLIQQFHRIGEEASFGDITVGARVIVRPVPEEDNLTAKLVLIITPRTANHVTGTITGISTADKTITIAPADGGDVITLNYNDRTRFILRGITGLAEGQSVRAVYGVEMIAKVVFSPIQAAESSE